MCLFSHPVIFMSSSFSSFALSFFLLGYRSLFRSILSDSNSKLLFTRSVSQEKTKKPYWEPLKSDQHSAPSLSKIQIEMGATFVSLHFDALASIGILLEELPKTVASLRIQIRPEARSLFCVRLCFGSRLLQPSFLRLVRTYIQEETSLRVRGLSCSRQSMQHILSACIGLDVNETKGKSQIIHQTLRSGMVYSVDGELLVYGDIHEGAQVQATGSITIMGVLSGTAHAGCNGNSNAQIFASTMEHPVLWIDSKHIENQHIVHKRGYSVASLQQNSKANKYAMGDV